MSATEAFDEISGRFPGVGRSRLSASAFKPFIGALYRHTPRSAVYGSETAKVLFGHDECDLAGDAGVWIVLHGETVPGHAASKEQGRQVWPSNTPAYDHAKAEIRSINADLLAQDHPGIPELAAQSMRHALRDVLATDSVYPSLSLDEDHSLLAEWRFGNEAIEVEATANGAVSWAHYRDGQLIKSSASRANLRGALRDLTATVEAANPNWRSLFRSHARR